MNKFKRIILAVKGNIGRAILLFMAIFLIVTLAFSSFLIYKTTKDINEDIKSSLDNMAAISWKVKDVSYRGVSDPTAFDNINAKLLESYESILNEDYISDSSMMAFSNTPFIIDGVMKGSEIYWHYATAINSSRRIGGIKADDFLFNNYTKLTDGRMINDDDVENHRLVALVRKGMVAASDKDLVYSNSYKPGDVIKIRFELLEEETDPSTIFASKTYEIEIVGEYDLTFDDDLIPTPKWWNKFDIFLPYIAFPETTYMDLVSDFKQLKEDNKKTIDNLEEDIMANRISLEPTVTYYDNIVFKTDSVEVFDDLFEHFDSSLDTYFSKLSSADEYNSIKAPLDNLSSLSFTILVVGVATAILVFFLIIYLYLKGRHKELGILLAMGEKRGSLVRVIAFEIILIAIFSIILALFLSELLAPILLEKVLGDLVEINSSFDYRILLIGFGLSFVIVLIIALLLTYKATKINIRELLM